VSVAASLSKSAKQRIRKLTSLVFPKAAFQAGSPVTAIWTPEHGAPTRHRSRSQIDHCGVNDLAWDQDFGAHTTSAPE
jgi:hypothetical protein